MTKLTLFEHICEIHPRIGTVSIRNIAVEVLLGHLLPLLDLADDLLEVLAKIVRDDLEVKHVPASALVADLVLRLQADETVAARKRSARLAANAYPVQAYLLSIKRENMKRRKE